MIVRAFPSQPADNLPKQSQDPRESKTYREQADRGCVFEFRRSVFDAEKKSDRNKEPDKGDKGTQGRILRYTKSREEDG